MLFFLFILFGFVISPVIWAAIKKALGSQKSFYDLMREIMQVPRTIRNCDFYKPAYHSSDRVIVETPRSKKTGKWRDKVAVYFKDANIRVDSHGHVIFVHDTKTDTYYFPKRNYQYVVIDWQNA